MSLASVLRVLPLLRPVIQVGPICRGTRSRRNGGHASIVLAARGRKIREDFEKYEQKVQNFNGFEVTRNSSNAFKILRNVF